MGANVIVAYTNTGTSTYSDDKFTLDLGSYSTYKDIVASIRYK